MLTAALLGIAEGGDCGHVHIQQTAVRAVQKRTEQGVLPAICGIGSETVGGH